MRDRDGAALAELNTPAVSVTESILKRGYPAGVFLRQAEPIDVHMLISAFCFFRIANRYTFGAIFGVDLGCPQVGVGPPWPSADCRARSPRPAAVLRCD